MTAKKPVAKTSATKKVAIKKTVKRVDRPKDEPQITHFDESAEAAAVAAEGAASIAETTEVVNIETLVDGEIQVKTVPLADHPPGIPDPCASYVDAVRIAAERHYGLPDPSGPPLYVLVNPENQDVLASPTNVIPAGYVGVRIRHRMEGQANHDVVNKEIFGQLQAMK